MKLKELRKANKLTQKQVAEQINIPKSSYARYELEISQAPINIYIELAKLFNVSLDELLDNPYKKAQTQNEFTLEEEELIDMFRELSEEKQNLILSNFYIFLPRQSRKNYEILKNIG